jgi:hypothetical protein
MGSAISSESLKNSELSNEDLEELSAFYKLSILERDLNKLKDILNEMKKIKECCAQSNELEGINASRKK